MKDDSLSANVSQSYITTVQSNDTPVAICLADTDLHLFLLKIKLFFSRGGGPVFNIYKGIIFQELHLQNICKINNSNNINFACG